METKNFTASKFKGNAGKLGGIGEALNLEAGFANGDVTRRKHLVAGAPNHQVDKLGLGDIGNQSLANFLAIPEANETIGNMEDFIKLVGNEHHRAAFGMGDTGEQSVPAAANAQADMIFKV